MHILLKDLLKEQYGDENEEYTELNSVKDIKDKVLDDMVAAAQKEYDEWVVDKDGNDAEVGGGGICHLIADELISALYKNGIHNCQSVCATHEQHVYVVGQFKEGIYEIDIPYSIYETGGGYSWKKIPDITFNRNSIVISRLSSDPGEISNYVDEMNENDGGDDAEYRAGWLKRHNAQYTDDGRLIAYHGTPTKNIKSIKKNGFKERTYFSLRPEYSKRIASTYHDVPEDKVTVLKVALPLDSINFIMSDIYSLRVLSFDETLPK